MGNAVWKLTSLVGISGLGFLILLQAQQGIQQSQAEAEVRAEAAESGHSDAGEDTRLAKDNAAEGASHSRTHLAGSHSHGASHEHSSDSHAERDEPAELGRAITWHTEPAADSGADEAELASLEPTPADGMKPVPQREPSTGEMHAAALPASPGLEAELASFPEASDAPVAPASFHAEIAGVPSEAESSENENAEKAPATIAHDHQPAPFRRENSPPDDLMLADASDDSAETTNEPPIDADTAINADGAAVTETPDTSSSPFAGFGPPPESLEPEPAAETDIDALEMDGAPSAVPGEFDPNTPVASDEAEPAAPTPAETPSPVNSIPEAPASDPAVDPAADSPFGSPLPMVETDADEAIPADSFPADSFGDELPADELPAMEDGSSGEDEVTAPDLKPLPEIEDGTSTAPETNQPTATDFGGELPGSGESEPRAEADGSESPAGPAAGNSEPFDPGLFQPEPVAQPTEVKPTEPELEPATDKIDPFAAVMEQEPLVDDPAPASSPFVELPAASGDVADSNTAGGTGASPADENAETGDEPFVIEDDPFASEPAPNAIKDDPFATESGPPAPDVLSGMESPEDETTAPEITPEKNNAAGQFGAGPPASPFGEIQGAEARPEPLGDDEAGSSGQQADLPSLDDGSAALPSEPELVRPGDVTLGMPGDGSASETGNASENPIELSGVESEAETAEPAEPSAAPRRREAQLTIKKTAPARAVIGEPVVYEIVVTNQGRRPAEDVKVSDVVPRGAKLKGTIPQATIKDHRLTWTLGTLDPNESATIRIQVVPLESGSLGSVATVTFEAKVPGRTKVVAPKLALTLTAPEEVALGEAVAFQFEIANVGTAPAKHVILRDILPAGFQHADGNDLEYEVGTLAPGAVESVTLRAATVKAGEYLNRAILTGEGGLKSEDRATVTVTGRPLSLIRQGPRRRLVGRPAEYTNIVRNTSSAPVESATVVETIPAGMTFVSATQDGQYNSETRSVAWRVGPLAPGEETTVSLTLTAAAEGAQESVVRIENVKGGPVQVASTTKVDSIASLAPTIQGLKDTVLVGQRAAFRILLANGGTAPVRDVLVSLALPPQLRFIEARGGEAIAGPNGVTTVRADAEIPTGAEHEIQFVVEAVAAGRARLRASIHAAQLDKPLVRDAELRVVAARS